MILPRQARDNHKISSKRRRFPCSGVGGFAELVEEVGTIRSYEWGVNNSPEEKDKGFTHLFCLTFDTEEDRDAYLPHPAHVAYGTKHVKAADVLVLDTLVG